MPLFSTPYPHILNSINGPTAPKHTFLIFYASFVDGQMWCPDCRAVESTVKAAFDADDKPKAIIQYVGDKPTWKDPNNSYRKEWGLESIPTILRWENGKEAARIVEYDIMDEEKFQSFLYPHGQ